MARQSDFTEDIGNEICAQIIEGKSLRKICRSSKMPHAATVCRWLADDRYKMFREQYAQACKERSEYHHEELIDLGDNALSMVKKATDSREASAMVQALRLKADNIKWSLARMNPKKYGDKLDVTSDGEKLPAPISQLPMKDAQSHASGS